MKRKGIDFRHAPHLACRDGDPKRDVNEDGRPIEWNYVVIVRLSQVETYIDEDGRSRYTYDALKAAPCIPGLSHSRTNMAYGKWRKNSTGRGFWVQTKPSLTLAQHKASEAAGDDNPEGHVQKWFDNYWTCPVYWVEDAAVYQGTVRSYEEPNR